VNLKSNKSTIISLEILAKPSKTKFHELHPVVLELLQEDSIIRQEDERGDFQAFHRVESAPKNKSHTIINVLPYNGSILFPTHVAGDSAEFKSATLTPQHSPGTATNRSANPER
jgi:hypothetical protein